jgi:hypothetical protein
MSTQPFARRLIYILLAAVLLAPAAYFICGGVVWYLVYTYEEYDTFDEDGHLEFDEERMEAHGASGMKRTFAIAGWTGVGIECTLCLSLLLRKRSKAEEQTD